MRWLRIVGVCCGVLCTAQPAHAAVAFLLHEAIGFAGETDGAGHAAVYLSNVCSDDGVTARECRAGEEGVVVSTYPEFLPRRSSYWMAVPLRAYLFGTDQTGEPPLYGSQAVLALLRSRYATNHPEIFPNAFDGQERPAGSWPHLIGSAIERTVYALQLETTREADARAIEALNAIQHRRAFDVSYNNCSDFSRFVLNTLFPGVVHRDGFNDFSFTTPKAIAKSLSAYGQAHPDLGFRILRYRQVDGPMQRSEPNRSLSEKLVVSRKYFALTLWLSPVSTAALAALYAATGRFDVEDQIAPVTDTARAAYQASIKHLEDEAVARHLFANETALKQFAVRLQAASAPEDEPATGLRLRVGVDGETRFIGLTRSNICDEESDPRLSYQLLLSLAAGARDGPASHQRNPREMDEDGRLLELLRDNPHVWERNAAQIGCASGAQCATPPRLPLWQRILRLVTH